MTNIPEDIRKAAENVIDGQRSGAKADWRVATEAILAERERCAKIAYDMAAAEVDHDAAGALFKAYLRIDKGA